MPEHPHDPSGPDSQTDRIRVNRSASDPPTTGMPPERDTERTARVSAGQIFPSTASDPGSDPGSGPLSGSRSAAGSFSPDTLSDAGHAQPSDFPAFSTWRPDAQASSSEPTDQAATGRNRRGRKRAAIIAGIAAGVIGLLYVADLVFTSGTVPRGTVVAGVDIGGLDKAAAERRLRDRLGPGLTRPVRLTAADATASVNPDDAGLKMDWGATIERAGSQPLSPITRVASLFTTREVAPVSSGDRAQVAQAIGKIRPQLERSPAEGTIRFDGTKPVAVDPVPGRTIDVQAATDNVLADWARGSVRVPFTEQPVSTTRDGVSEALQKVAQPAVSAPVTVRGENTDAVLPPVVIAKALRFHPDGTGGLKSTVDIPALVPSLEPQLAGTIQPGRDAEIVLEGGRPVVHPSTDGRGIDWPKSFERLIDILKQRNDRAVQAVYVNQPAKLTTDQANQLGIRDVVSEFTTGGFEPASGVNIRRVAEQVNGAIIKPGETFSLNGHTGPRGTPQGYIESGVIEDGRPAKAVGGGISQFATTLYNASYFAGMKDIEHKPHSYYISRYPAGREATVFQNPDGSSVIDVKFKNTSKSGILIETNWTPSSITIRFWGTKQYDVTSQTSDQTDPTPPQEMVVPPGQPCSPSKGTPGFTVFDTRTIRELDTGKVTAEKPRKTVYNPQPIIHCGPPPGP